MERIDKNNFCLLASRKGLVGPVNGQYYLMDCNLSFRFLDESETAVVVDGIIPLELAKRILELERESQELNPSFLSELREKVKNPMRFPKKDSYCGFSQMFSEESIESEDLSLKYGNEFISGLTVYSIEVLETIVDESKGYYKEKSPISKNK